MGIVLVSRVTQHVSLVQHILLTLPEFIPAGIALISRVTQHVSLVQHILLRLPKFIPVGSRWYLE